MSKRGRPYLVELKDFSSDHVAWGGEPGDGYRLN